MIGQDEQDRIKLGSLAFVDRHGINRFIFGQALGRKPPVLTCPVRENSRQFAIFIGIGQDQADISIVKPELGMIAGDHHRLTAIAGPSGTDEMSGLKNIFNVLIDGHDAERTLPQGTQNPETLKGCKNIIPCRTGMDQIQIISETIQDKWFQNAFKFIGFW